MCLLLEITKQTECRGLVCLISTPPFLRVERKEAVVTTFGNL